jgi:succinate-semialdehyde dehydrogenase / glutarate-semialdehyde dehydrogenase
VGPLARADLREIVADQVERSISAGARCLLGGRIPEGPGFFYPPTILTDVRPGMPVFSEEVFGPVSAVIPVEDEKEAISCANRGRSWRRAAVSSTLTCARIRGCRSAESRRAASAGSSPLSASASS